MTILNSKLKCDTNFFPNGVNLITSSVQADKLKIYLISISAILYFN